MLAIGFRFLAGRYHANPWGRHVNEADVEWPPASWRLCRALISTWYHKLDHDRFPYNRLERLIDELGGTLPLYRLPPAVHAHSRHYLPQWKGNTSLVFDAFARLDPDDELIMAWPNLAPDPAQLGLLDELLRCMGYLGRAESWVEARRLGDAEIPGDLSAGVEGEAAGLCRPGDDTVDRETGEIRGEVVRLLAPLSPDAYRQWRDEFVSKELAGLSGKRKKLLQATTPESLAGALSLDTGDLQRAGWSQPPAGRFVDYLRPLDCLRPTQARPVACPVPVTTARFMLVGKPLPRLEDALRVGECFRAAVMGKAKYVLQGDDRIPPELSGHGLDDGNRHGHAFYLPEDADGDGRIDHLVVHAPAGLSPPALRVLRRLTRVRGRRGVEWQVVLEGEGWADAFAADSPYTQESAEWRSVTPYLRPWHLKKNRAAAGQVLAFIRKELRLRGVGVELEDIEWLPEIEVRGKKRRPLHFHRFRHKRGILQPDTQGYFLYLRFARPLRGPLALGFACHYGLGVFAAVR